MIANQESGTRVDEVASGIYRISTPIDVIPGGFTLNSYLVADDEPLLFHTGYRKLFPITLEAIGKVMPVEKLRWIGGSHFEGDEFGALNEFLAAAPEATPFGTEIGVLASLNDFASKAARGFGDGEEFSIGSRRMKWLYTPHVPHGWDCGILFDQSTGTLLCGDLFTQAGANHAACHRIGSPVRQRSNARDDGLLRTWGEYNTCSGAPGEPRIRRCWHANMEALIVAMALRCCANCPTRLSGGTAGHDRKISQWRRLMLCR